ncbi:MAG: phosphatase PAP2 family protein [Patescibacteria group bacterium]
MDGLNYSLFNFIHGASGRNFLFDSFVIFIAQYLPYFIFLGFLWLALSQRGWRKKIFFLIEAFIAVILSRGLITEIIRFFYYSPRPFEALNFQSLIPESGSSMPSGHAAFLFALSAAVYFWNRRWGIWFFVISLIVSVARIFVGVHWPLDIEVGMAVGILSGLFVRRLLSGYLGKLREHVLSPAVSE